MDDNIKKSPYRGIVIICVILILVPLFLTGLFLSLIGSFQKNYSDELNHCTAVFLGCGTGFLFQLSCIMLGLLKGAFRITIKRICDFFGNLSISFRFAITMYWDDIVENGVVFLIVSPIIFITLGIALHNLFDCISMLSV